MRGLSQQFMDDLNTGVLAALRERVLADRSLCLEIRDDYVNVYYRGGSLLKLSTGPGGYVAFFEPKYAKGDGGALERALPNWKRSAHGSGGGHSPEDTASAHDHAEWRLQTASTAGLRHLPLGPYLGQ